MIDIDFESRTRRHNDCSYSPGVATTMSTPDSRFKALLSDSTFVPPKRKIKVLREKEGREKEGRRKEGREKEGWIDGWMDGNRESQRIE